MEETISVRIPKEKVNALRQIAKAENTLQSVLLREILSLGIEYKKQELALALFQKGQATAWKAAEIAGIPLTEFLDLMKKRGIEFNYTKEEFLEDIEGL